MHKHVQHEYPLEACGLIAGKEGQSVHIYEIQNELRSPIRFRMQPKQQLLALLDMEDKAFDLLAIYHSHPNGPSGPSSTDVREAAYPEALHLIWSRSRSAWTANAFRIFSDRIDSLPITISKQE